MAVTIMSKAREAICASAKVTGFLIDAVLEVGIGGEVEASLAAAPPSEPPEPELPVELSLLLRMA